MEEEKNTVKEEKPAVKTEAAQNGEKRLKKIVHLDDLNFSLIMLKDQLKKDYEVYPAQTIEKMFEILERIKADLILLDVNMPDVDGFKAIEQIKADKRFANIPVVFFTARRDKASIIKGIRLGAVDFISKPVGSAELLKEQIELCINPEKRAAIRPIILAIDDTPSILNAINSLLSEQYTVYTLPHAKNDHVIKELVKKTTPDLFLLDYNMPGLTGFDIVPIVRSIKGYETIPIIFLTSEKSMDHLTVAISLGACDYIVKPIDEVILHKKIAKHLSDFLIKRRIRALEENR
jgi:DNA-binding response OmpR family regulator